jgi:hypothetical protein
MTAELLGLTILLLLCGEVWVVVLRRDAWGDSVLSPAKTHEHQKPKPEY